MHATAPVPKFCTIPDWCTMSGMRRSNTYLAISAGHLRAIKLGNRTLIEVAPGLAWLDSLPAAEIRIPGTKRAS